MNNLDCDVAIIGAGTAGLAAERRARADGARTLLIDDKFAGTTCATVGCMPSKLLIAAAHAAHGARTAAVFGVKLPEPEIDGPAVMARVRQERDAFAAGTVETIEEIPATIRIRSRARFVDATTLALDDGRKIKAKAIVIATGSHPNIPPQFEALGDRVLTNETIFELADLPRAVAVIGAGPLGLELAQALVRLGVDTQVFDQGPHLAGLHDDAVAAELHTILERELPIRLGVKLDVQREGDGVRLAWSGTSTGEATFDYALVAVGRPPSLKGLDLEKTGLVLDKHGVPGFDSHTMRCGTSSIFLAGDADGDRAILHEASAEGAIAGRNAAAYPHVEAGKRSVPFSVMFTDPPLAVVGAPADPHTVIGCASYADQGRAKIEARNAGLVRLYASHPDGKLTGGALVGPGMEHIGHLIAWAVSRGETAASLLAMPFYHPTFEEGLKSALRAICAQIHAPLPRDSDEGAASGG
jgi:dihydrolipoamide dehydrogenase